MGKVMLDVDIWSSRVVYFALSNFAGEGFWKTHYYKEDASLTLNTLIVEFNKI